MYDQAMGCQPDDGRLGFAPAVVATTAGPSLVSSALSTVASFLGPFGSILRGSDPVKDAQRKGRIDTYYAGAMAGDVASEARLRCYAGQTTPEMIQLAAGANPQCDPNDPAGHAAGSAVARGYARAKLGELEARRAAGIVGGTLIGQSDIPTAIGGALQRAATSPVAVVVAVAVVALLASKMRRGRS